MKSSKKGLSFLIAGLAVLFIASVYGISGPMPQMSSRERAVWNEYQNAKASLQRIKRECNRASFPENLVICPKVAAQEVHFKLKEKAAQTLRLLPR